MVERRRQEVEQDSAFGGRGDVDRAIVIVRLAAGERSRCRDDRSTSFGQRPGFLFVVGDEAIGTGNPFIESRIFLFRRRERRETRVALFAFGFAEVGIEADALIEDEALAL